MALSYIYYNTHSIYIQLATLYITNQWYWMLRIVSAMVLNATHCWRNGIECYALLASRSAHVKLEARITLGYVQCGTHTHMYEKSPVKFTMRARYACQLKGVTCWMPLSCPCINMKNSWHRDFHIYTVNTRCAHYLSLWWDQIKNGLSCFRVGPTHRLIQCEHGEYWLCKNHNVICFPYLCRDFPVLLNLVSMVSIRLYLSPWILAITLIFYQIATYPQSLANLAQCSAHIPTTACFPSRWLCIQLSTNVQDAVTMMDSNVTSKTSATSGGFM